MSARHGTAHASLAVLGLKLRQLDLFGPIRDEVSIAIEISPKTPRWNSPARVFGVGVSPPSVVR